jgi:Rrf2 family protein
MITRRSKYAIRAMLVLVRRSQKGALSTEAIAQSEGLPRKFLEAIMLDLKEAGLVQAIRGKGGGYTLSRAPGKITVGQIIRAAQGSVAPTPCVSATAYAACDDCPDERACAVRPLMRQVREAISKVIDLKSIDALARETADLAPAAADGFDI